MSSPTSVLFPTFTLLANIAGPCGLPSILPPRQSFWFLCRGLETTAERRRTKLQRPRPRSVQTLRLHLPVGEQQGFTRSKISLCLKLCLDRNQTCRQAFGNICGVNTATTTPPSITPVSGAPPTGSSDESASLHNQKSEPAYRVCLIVPEALLAGFWTLSLSLSHFMSLNHS